MSAEIIDDAEWERRFKARIVAMSTVTAEGAQATFDAIPIADWRDDDLSPEEAADEEMSNWDDDWEGTH